MLQASQHTLDKGLRGALVEAGLVGERLHEDLVHELKSKIILRSGRDPVEVVGKSGTGKHMVANAAHIACKALLDRKGPLVAYNCEEGAGDPTKGVLQALHKAQGGTLLLESFDHLRETERRTLLRHINNTGHDAFVISLREEGSHILPSKTDELPATIRLKPLHEREEDVWNLIDHFFESCVSDASQPEFAKRCRGFSRQAKADISQTIETVGLSSVRQLRAVVRDVVFGAFSLVEIPLKITSDEVRPHLVERFGQTDAMREAREAASVGSRFDELLDRTLLEQLAEIHGVPVGLMQRQAELVSEIIGYIDDVPRSYRNILDRAEDIERAGLWLMTGARTQAEFRRYFGEERYMRPTKSVAWAFYNRVFKRDM